MQLVLDSEKTYTYGDWVTGKVLLGHDEASAKSLLIELRGVISWTAVTEHLKDTPDQIAHSETIYFKKEQTKLSRRSYSSTEQTDCITVNFSIRFPGHKHGDFQTIPGTFADDYYHNHLKALRCRHTLTATVLGHKNPESSRQEMAELQFKPSESVKLLYAPDITYHEEEFQGLAAAIDITVPPYFVQGGVENKIHIQLREPDASLFQFGRLFCRVNWIAFGKEKTGTTLNMVLTINGKISIERSEASTKAEFSIQLECDKPQYQSDHLSAGGFAHIGIQLLNLKTQRSHTLSYRKQITLLPALLKKDGLDGFATKEEITAILLAKAGVTSGAYLLMSPGLSGSKTATEECSPPPYSELIE